MNTLDERLDRQTIHQQTRATESTTMTPTEPDPDPVAVVRGLTKKYQKFTAVDDVSFELRPGTLYGLLGRNGAGKTTLMRLLTGQVPASVGTLEVFGATPFENERVAQQICFISESQRYPDGFRVCHVLAAGALLFPHWDAEYAEALVDDFGLPRSRPVKKLSRGMLSAVGIVVGLASQAPLTLFDEPYLDLDAFARQLFYDRLLADYAERPRTVVLSTHLIDEVSDLIEHVLVIDRGRLVIDEDAETLRGRAVIATGPVSAVEEFTGSRPRMHSERIAGQARVTVLGQGSDSERARTLGLRLEPVSLQQLVIRTTGAGTPDAADPADTAASPNGASR